MAADGRVTVSERRSIGVIVSIILSEVTVSVESVRRICRALPAVTEDVKWGSDLVFSVGGKMFAVIDLEPPHSVAFKCTEESFGELIERAGIVPAPYLARAMWVQETEFGEAFDLRELQVLLKTAYDIVVAKLPKSKRPGAAGRHLKR
jgi:predicted DNA-binding protein (MmcQ/YjbR family)